MAASSDPVVMEVKYTLELGKGRFCADCDLSCQVSIITCSSGKGFSTWDINKCSKWYPPFNTHTHTDTLDRVRDSRYLRHFLN